MDNNYIIKSIKENITVDTVLNDYDSLIKSYITSRILEFKNCKFTKKLKSDVTKYTKELRSLTENYKKELKSIKNNNIGQEKKQKQLLKNEYKKKLYEMESKYNFSTVTHLFNIVKALNGNKLDNPSNEVKTDIYNMFSVCNGSIGNLPFLVNFSIDYLHDRLGHEHNVDEESFVVTTNSIVKVFSTQNYKHGFDSLFKNKKLISDIAKNRLSCNENEVGISSIFKLSHVDNIKQFTFEKMCDTVNLIAAELTTNVDAKASDQTNTVNSFGEPFYEDEFVRIFRANIKEKSIEYGTGYSFCISTTTGFNYFNKYRFMKMGSCGYETTPHFVFFKNKEFQNEKGMYGSGVNSGIFDKWNMCIVDLCWKDEREKEHVWYYTTSRNDGTKNTNPEEIKKYAKDLIKYPIDALKTDKSKYNNDLSKALKNSKGFETYPYTEQELLLKEYSNELGNSKEITLNTSFKKNARTVKNIFETEHQGRIFADVLLSNLKEFKISDEIFKYIYEKFDHKKLNGDSITGRTRYIIYNNNYTDISTAIQDGVCVKKLEKAIGLPVREYNEDEIDKFIEESEKEEQQAVAE